MFSGSAISVIFIGLLACSVARDCYESSGDSSSGLCFYNTKSDSSVVTYICSGPQVKCNETICDKCVGVYSAGIPIAAIVLACIGIVAAMIALVMAAKNRKF